MPEAFLSIGSNLGDRKNNISAALKLLSGKCRLLSLSSVYETEPEGYEAQPDFLNCAVKVKTDKTPEELLITLKGIEAKLGRTELFKNGPRIIDIDILYYESDITVSNNLKIPHPLLHKRAFVLVPLSEIAPVFTHPILHKTNLELLNELNSQKRVRKYGEIPTHLIGG